MKKNLLIEDYEDKKTKDGKRYVRFKTSEGWMSCFDSVSNDALKAFENKTACCEVVESGDFSNIKKCYGVAEEISESIPSIPDQKPEVVKPGEVVPKNNVVGKNATMYTSYAKDVFVAMTTGREPTTIDQAKIGMEQAIALVKQAKEAFE